MWSLTPDSLLMNLIIMKVFSGLYDSMILWNIYQKEDTNTIIEKWSIFFKLSCYMRHINSRLMLSVSLNPKTPFYPTAYTTSTAKGISKTCYSWFLACSLASQHTQKRPRRGMLLTFPLFGLLFSCSDFHKMFGVCVALRFSVN